MRAEAQLFGERTLGQPLRSRSEAPSGSQALSQGFGLGSSMFERAARDARDFVGLDPRERQTFVGLSQGTVNEAVNGANLALQRSRAEEIVRRRAQNANLQQVQQGGAGAGPTYPARLTVRFAHPDPRSAEADVRIEDSVAQVLQGRGWTQVAVRSDGGRVTLTGRVGADYERGLIEAVVSLEPGVRRVVNRLETVR
jgi:hypothetical protein